MDHTGESGEFQRLLKLVAGDTSLHGTVAGVLSLWRLVGRRFLYWSDSLSQVLGMSHQWQEPGWWLD